MRNSAAFCMAYSILQCLASSSFILSNSNCCKADSGKNFIKVIGEWEVESGFGMILRRYFLNSLTSLLSPISFALLKINFDMVVTSPQHLVLFVK